MDITKGFLEDISRPASSEIRRPSRDGGRSLEVLSADQCSTDYFTEESDEENEDPELREAIKKMKRLDRVLALKASAEREVKQRGKQQHQRLWQELQVRLWIKHTSASYRRLCDGDEVDFVPVFETEVLDLKSDCVSVCVCVCDAGHAEAGQQLMEDQPSDSRQRGAARSKRRQDFVKRNIELTEASGNSFLLTQQEKERIEELLKDLEEEENSICEGFGPEPSELHSLRHIDSRLQLLLPVQYFLSVRSPSQVLISKKTVILQNVITI
uniref:Fibrous sheath-interacting protein 1 n=1 Tax=Sinocyclocheilus anshuiensis TaxID=1608454 RepID=A0A671L4Q6_9TELE